MPKYKSQNSAAHYTVYDNKTDFPVIVSGTAEECAKAIDMGNFYRVPADNRTLNYDKFFTEGDEKRVTLSEFNSDNTRRLTVEETKEKIAALEYIQNELKGIANIAK